MLEIVLLYVLGQIVHLKTKRVLTSVEKEPFLVEKMLQCHLDGAGHGAKGEHGRTVLNSGLTIKCSLSVNQEDSNLQTAAGEFAGRDS